MIEELNPRARALLDAARGGLDPSDAVLARVRDRVVAGGVAGTAAATGVGLAGKLAVVGAVAAIAVGSWLALGRGGEVATIPHAPELAAPLEPTATSRFEPPPAAALPPPAPAPVVTRPRRATAPIAPAALTLADEVALVDAAIAALRAGDPAAALTTTDRYAARAAGGGQLAEEATALRVEALCRLGDPRADAARDRFDARWPTSTQRPRIAVACRGAR